MNIWNSEQVTLRERDSFLPFRKVFRLIKSDFKNATPGDFESSSMRCFPLAFLSAYRCLCALYTTAVIVVSAFNYQGDGWLSWLPFAVQVSTGLYFMMAAILSQVLYLILVCIKGNFCRISKTLEDTSSDENSLDEIPRGENGSYSAVRETRSKETKDKMEAASSTFDLNHTVPEQIVVGRLSIFHHILWIFADISPCLSTVLTILVVVDDPTLLKHSGKNVKDWYVAINIYIFTTTMLIMDFILGRIPKRVTRVLIPTLFSLVFWIVVKSTSETRQLLPPINCQASACSLKQEMYIVVGTPIAYCLFLFLYYLKNMIMGSKKHSVDWV